MADMGDFWVFGYGSLMWRPGFAHVEQRRALLAGYRRALCVRSYDHRGDAERPGLVLGLDRGGSCVGIAFRVAHEQRAPVLDYLRARELVSSVYVERTLPVRLADGALVTATAYVVDRLHPDYAGDLTEDGALGIVASAVGASGANRDYLLSTVAYLKALAIRDPRLEALAERLQDMGEAPSS